MRRALCVSVLALMAALPTAPVSHAAPGDPIFAFTEPLSTSSGELGGPLLIEVRRSDEYLWTNPKVGCSFTPYVPPGNPDDVLATPPGEPNADYTTAYSPIKFEPGAALGYCTFTQVSEELVEEAREWVLARIVGPPWVQDTLVVQLGDDESNQPMYFRDGGSITVSEDTPSVSLRVFRNLAFAYNDIFVVPKLWCRFSPYPGPPDETATPPGIEGADYTKVTSPLRFKRGERTGLCPFTPVDDDLAESTEYVKVEIEGLTWIGGLDPLIIGVADDDGTGRPTSR